MTIGMASRLHAFRTLTRSRSDGAQEDEEHRVRCDWSIFILEKAFGQQPGVFEGFETPSKDALSAPWPPPLIEECDNNQANGAPDMEEASQGLGILVACFGQISIWGGISSYLHELRSGRAESPWLPTSTSARLNLQIFEWEARLSPRHLLRNVAFVGRSAAELLEHQEYCMFSLRFQTFTSVDHGLLVCTIISPFFVGNLLSSSSAFFTSLLMVTSWTVPTRVLTFMQGHPGHLCRSPGTQYEQF